MDILKQLKEKAELDKLNRRIVKALIPIRRDDDHKGTFGKVLIIAGSKGMCGAACLCAGAALRTGSGLVRVAVPEELFTIVQISVKEATCIDRKNIISGEYNLNEYDAVAIGPGLGTGYEAKTVVSSVIKEYDGPLVIDADGLNIISEDEELLGRLKARSSEYETIITPHPGEARRLLKNCSKEKNDADLTREETADALVKLTGCTVLYKGHDTIIARKIDGFDFGSYEELPDENEKNTCTEDCVIEMVKNTTGNPGMATGGSGDVLTGVIVSLLGQGLNSFDSARAGAYIHGLAGDLAAAEFGEAGLIAGDIVKYLAYAIKAIQE